MYFFINEVVIFINKVVYVWNMREREREKHFGRFWFFNFGVDVVCMNNIIIETSPFYIIVRCD